MSDQQIRKRRITLLVIIAIILTSAAGGWYAYQGSRQTHRIQQQLADGLAAYERGDYETTFTQLEPLAATQRFDAKTHKAFGYAAMATAPEHNQRVMPGLRSLREAFFLDPADAKLGHEVLNYMIEFGLDAEALNVADRLITGHPQDLAAHRAKAQILTRVNRLSEAIDAAKAGLKLNPLDSNLLLLSIQLRQRVGQSPDVILSDVQKLKREHPEDPRVSLALAMVLEMGKDTAAAREHVDAAYQADLPEGDEAYLSNLVLFLDAVGRQDRALETLAAHATPDQPAVYAELVQRLMETHQEAQAVEAIDQIPADQRDILMQTLKAIALHRLGQGEQAQAVIAEIAAMHENTGLGSLIAEALMSTFDPQAQAQAQVEALKAALDKASNMSMLRALLAQAHTRAGQADLARQQWLQAARQRPNWVEPLVALAEEAVRRSDIPPATALADRARTLAPNDPSVQTVWIMAASRNPRIEPDALRLMLDQTDRLLRDHPDDASLLVAKTELLARLNRKTDAIAAAELALAPAPAADRAALLHLAEVNRQHELGLGQRIEQTIAQHHGQSPELASIQAMRLIDEDRPDQALALLDEAVAKAPDADKAPWRLTRARMLDRIDPDKAAANWLTLAEQLPDSAEAQQRALMTHEIQDDRKLMGRTIERLGKTLGESDARYRLYRAAYLLSDPQADAFKTNAEQATQLIKLVLEQDANNTQALLLDAIAMERLGRKDTALLRVKAAAEQAPGSPAIALKQAQLCAQLGLSRQGIDAARLTANSTLATTEQRVAAATILVSLGEHQTARHVLADLERHNRLPDEAVVLLAQLYVASNEIDRAIAVLTRLDNRTPETVILLAALEHMKGEEAQAQATLARLDEFGLNPTRRAALLADYYHRIGSGDDAAGHLFAAARDQPKDLQAWQRLISYLIETGRAEQAIAALASAIKHHPNDPGLTALSTHTDALTNSASRSVFRPLLLTELLSDTSRDAAGKALDMLHEAEVSSWTVAELTDRLGQLAQSHPDVLSIQNLAAEVNLNAGRAEVASDLAVAAMNRFPTDVRSAVIAARASVAAKRWQTAIQAVDAWKRRAAGPAPEADLLAAEAQLGMGDPRGAVATLEPHVQAALAQPDANHQTLIVYARALITENSVAKARSTLTPLLGSSDWRLAYIQLGSNIKRADDARNWYNAVSSTIPADAVNEQMALTQGIFLSGQRAGDESLINQARQRADELANRPDASATAFYFRGTLLERLNDLPAAEADYRRALFLDPNLIPVKNNLAMTLAKLGKAPAESIELAQAVVDSAPNDANALDTLAYTQFIAGQYDQAIATIERAIQLQPNEAKWQQRRAEIVAKRREQAASAAPAE